MSLFEIIIIYRNIYAILCHRLMRDVTETFIMNAMLSHDELNNYMEKRKFILFEEKRHLRRRRKKTTFTYILLFFISSCFFFYACALEYYYFICGEENMRHLLPPHHFSELFSILTTTFTEYGFIYVVSSERHLSYYSISKRNIHATFSIHLII